MFLGQGSSCAAIQEEEGHYDKATPRLTMELRKKKRKLASSASAMADYKRKTEERRVALEADPEIGRVEESRVWCKRCAKWIGGTIGKYSQTNWVVHKRGSAHINGGKRRNRKRALGKSNATERNEHKWAMEARTRNCIPTPLFKIRQHLEPLDSDSGPAGDWPLEVTKMEEETDEGWLLYGFRAVKNQLGSILKVVSDLE